MIIAALCAYKLSRSDESSDPDRPVVAIRQAPFFELYDHRKPPQVVRLKSFIGRHWIVLAFFDEKTGLADPVLAWLRENAESLRRENVKVFAISTALPQTHRKMLEKTLKADEPIPFQMLSDIEGYAHQQFGLVDEDRKRSTGVFLIDRAGNLRWNRERPLPLEDPTAELAREFELE